MNMLMHGSSRPMLAQQVKWFVTAIAVAAWRWRKPPFPGIVETQRIADEEETRIMIDALIYGVLRPAFLHPVEVDFMKVFDDFFADPKVDARTSLDLAVLLADRLMTALEA